MRSLSASTAEFHKSDDVGRHAAGRQRCYAPSLLWQSSQAVNQEYVLSTNHVSSLDNLTVEPDAN